MLNLRVEVLQQYPDLESVQTFSTKHTTVMDKPSGEPGGGKKWEAAVEDGIKF